jgi:hypothetical protein
MQDPALFLGVQDSLQNFSIDQRHFGKWVAGLALNWVYAQSAQSHEN